MRTAGVAGVFVAVAGAVIGLAVAFGPESPTPVQPGDSAPVAEVIVSTTTADVPSAAVEPIAPVEVASPVTTTTEAPVAQAPAQVPAKKRNAPAAVPAVTEEEPVAEPTLGPGGSTEAPPPPACQWVYDGPDDHIGHEVCA
jgi:hypothetical protein